MKPGNKPAWALWSRVGNQWRTAGLTGQLLSLDLNAVYSTADRMHIPWTPGLGHKIQALELATLERVGGTDGKK